MQEEIVEVTSTCAQNGFSVTTTLPGWTGSMDDWPCQYAGTLQSSATDAGNQLFFWMYRAPDDDAPLTIWMNGGPGASSTFANFLLNGPMRITRIGDDISTGYEVSLAEKGSWDSESHMVFLDQPIGTGFSYGTPLLTNMEDAGNQFETWLNNFMEAFPEFKGRDLYITGESYAGKYIPYYAW